MTRAALLVSTLLIIGAASLYAENAGDKKKLLATGKCPGCDLQKVQLVNANLRGADLRGADLSNSFLYRVDLEGALLKNANLTGANLGGTNLRGAVDANLLNATTNEYTTCPNGKAGPCGG